MRNFVGRRIVQMPCTYSFLSAVLRGEIGSRPGMIIHTNAPSDLVVVGIENSPEPDQGAFLYLESETFEPVGQDNIVPVQECFYYTVIDAAWLTPLSFVKEYDPPV